MVKYEDFLVFSVLKIECPWILECWSDTNKQ